MEITFNQGDTTHRGKVITIEKDKEFQYFLNLGENLQFTIHLSDDGYWESDNHSVDPLMVMLAGDAIENMEDFSDVISELNKIRL